MSMRKKNPRRWEHWIKKRNPRGNPQRLTSSNVYILPSKFGWIYGLVLLTFFTGAINYQISTVFLMTFLLAIIGLISAWEAQGNLKGLSIQLISIGDTQQGKPAQITLLIQPGDKVRFALEFQLDKQPKTRLEKIPLEGIQFILPIETIARGCFTLPPIVISSVFPFGIFQVWGYAFFEERYYVYPPPLFTDLWPLQLTNQQNKKMDITGDNEFYDLKQVENPWSQPNRIAWKIAAKGQGWYVKTMNTSEGDYWLFKLNDLPMGDLEKKLQNLSYWLHTAEEKGHIYALELKHLATPMGNGEQQLLYCLRQLAIYQ